MGFTNLTPGVNPNATTQINNNFSLTLRSAGLTWINMCKDRLLYLPADGGIFVEAYTSAGGRQSSVVTAETSAVFDANKYNPYVVAQANTLFGSGNYIVIEAANVTPSSFAINNCQILNADAGKWILGCTTGTNAVKRAQIYRTLFVNNIVVTGITGLTALRVPWTRDVSKRAYYATASHSVASGSSFVGRWVGTFAGGTNNSVSIWASASRGTTSAGGTSRIQFPNLTTILNAPDPGTNSWYGTDRESNELNSPADVSIFCDKPDTGGSGTQTMSGNFLILTGLTMTFANTGGTITTKTSTDFTTTHSVPVLSAIGTSLDNLEVLVTHTIPAGTFPSDMSSSILTFDPADFEEGGSVEYKLSTITGPYVIIEATSVSSLNDFAINDCSLRKISAGKWVLGCTTGSDEVKRAKIYATLFYGTNGTNPRASSTYITGITALKTSVARDVGKQAYNVYSFVNGVSGSHTYTGTFANTTTNNSCSSWSDITAASPGIRPIYWELPNNTILNTANEGSHIGTDRAADETDNPANCRINHDHGGIGFTSTARAFVLSSGTVSWVKSGSNTVSVIDFNVDNSIPVFTATSEFTPYETAWLETNKTEPFTAFTLEPSTLTVKLIPKSVSPTAGYPSIRGICLQAGRAIE